MESHAKKYLIAAVSLLMVVFVLYQYRNAAYAKMKDWKLAQQPQKFTELYFNDDLNLPNHVSQGEKILFSFMVHNLEGETMQYPYGVYFKSSDGKIEQTIEENNLMLGDGESETVNESYMAGSDGNIGSIVIVLKDQSQEIHFLLN